MGVLVLSVNTALADDCKGKHKKLPGCDGPGPGGDPSAIVYTAKLTGPLTGPLDEFGEPTPTPGAFEFGSLDATLNSNETVLRSTDSVTVFRPVESSAPNEAALWDSVFAQCNIFFGPTPVDVPSFTAPPDGKGWTIEKPGGIRVNFRNIPLSIPNIGDVEFTLSLIGETPYSDPFLPVDPDTTIAHELTRFEVQGTTAKKVKPRLVCHDESAPGAGDLTTPSILTIEVK